MSSVVERKSRRCPCGCDRVPLSQPRCGSFGSSNSIPTALRLSHLSDVVFPHLSYHYSYLTWKICLTVGGCDLTDQHNSTQALRPSEVQKCVMHRMLSQRRTNNESHSLVASFIEF